MVPVCHPSWHVFFCALLLVSWSLAEDVTESDLPLYLGWWLYVWDGPRYLKAAAAPHLVCNRRVRLFGDRVCYCTLFHIKCQRVILFSCCWLCLSFREHNEVTHFSNITCDTLSPQWLMMEVRRSVGRSVDNWKWNWIGGTSRRLLSHSTRSSTPLNWVLILKSRVHELLSHMKWCRSGGIDGNQ